MASPQPSAVLPSPRPESLWQRWELRDAEPAAARTRRAAWVAELGEVAGTAAAVVAEPAVGEPAPAGLSPVGLVLVGPDLAEALIEEAAQPVAAAELPASAVRRRAKAPAAARAAEVVLLANLVETEQHFAKALAGLGALAEAAADFAAAPEQDPESIQCRAVTGPRTPPAPARPDCLAGTRNRNGRAAS